MCITILLQLCVVAASGKCKPNENEICYGDWKRCFCRTCISCPKGYGPSHPCGGRYLNGTVIKCTPCTAGVSYSEERSVASCQPCPLCGGKETLQKCTPKRKTSCGTKCKKGYIMNTAVDHCLPDPSFTTPAKSPPMTPAPKTTRIFASTASGPSNKGTIQVTSQPSNLITSGRDGKPTSKDPEGHSRDNKIIILTLVGVAAVVIVVYCLLKKKQVACLRRKNGRNQDDEAKIALAEYKETTSSARSSQEIGTLRLFIHYYNI